MGDYINVRGYGFAITPVEMTAGKEYHLSRNGYGSFCEPDYVFSICAPSKHVGPLTATKVIQEPTCTEPGTKAQCCALCGGEVNRTIIPPTGHKPGKEQVFENATCMSTGLRGTKCTVCGEYITKVVIPTTAHTPDVWTDLRPATCTGDGYRAQRCLICGETLKSETVPAFGHSYSEWTAYNESQQSRYCIYCGNVEYRDNP